jgi:hypothetical protein
MREPFFMTEKETEEWLELETRSVRMPDGATRPLTLFRLAWNSFDHVIESGLFTDTELAGLAVEASNETGQPFDRTFPNMVAYVAREVRKMNERLISERRRLRRKR